MAALNKARVGAPDPQTIRLFESCIRPLQHDESIKPTKIYPVRARVQEENQREFDALTGPIHNYSANDMQSSPEGTPNLIHLLNDLQAPRALQLRVGAQVMLLANLDVKGGLVNGSRGVVTDFASMEEATEHLQLQAIMRGAGKEDQSMALGELNSFVRENKKMLFPKVVFETRNSKREVTSLDVQTNKR